MYVVFSLEWMNIWKNTDGQTECICKHLKKHHGLVWRELVLSNKLKGWDKVDLPKTTPQGPVYNLEEFTVTGFYEWLVCWIIADDQVSHCSGKLICMFGCPLNFDLLVNQCNWMSRASRSFALPRNSTWSIRFATLHKDRRPYLFAARRGVRCGNFRQWLSTREAVLEERQVRYSSREEPCAR